MRITTGRAGCVRRRRRRGCPGGSRSGSAHNWTPAIALDVVPAPLDWTDLDRFRALAALVKAEAKARGVPLAWGGDWVRLRDMPHYELDPWRRFAAEATPYAD